MGWLAKPWCTRKLNIRPTEALLNNVVSKWATGKGGDVWQQFSDGFGVGALSGMGKWAYNEYVGFEATEKSGGRAPTELERDGRFAVPGYNVIGNEAGKPAHGIFEQFVCDYAPGREGGVISNVVNYFPGMNSFAALHDTMTGRLALGVPIVDVLWSGALFVPAFYGNYYALYPELSRYYR